MAQTHKETAEKRFVVSPRYQVAFVDADTVFLVDERGYIALEGTGAVAILQCVHHIPRTTEAIAQHVSAVLCPDEARAFLTRLIEDGYVVEYHRDLDNQTVAYWQAQGLDAKRATDRLRNARVTLLTVGSVDGAPLAKQLHQMNIEVINHATHPFPTD